MLSHDSDANNDQYISESENENISQIMQSVRHSSKVLMEQNRQENIDFSSHANQRPERNTVSEKHCCNSCKG